MTRNRLTTAAVIAVAALGTFVTLAIMERAWAALG
jgi:hypothetical protein